jgi:diaminopimelate epimerase
MIFAKMHGLGNDFIVIDNRDEGIKNLNDLAVKICDRHFGIGADGILIVEKSNSADIKMNIINSDGSTAEMCGNGIRCFSKYVYEKGIINKQVMNIETLAGIMKAELSIENSKVINIRVNMGSPILDKMSIPFDSIEDNMNYTIEVEGKSYNGTTLLLGVPHTVVYVNKIDKNEVIEYGKKIENLDIFPSKTNVNFVNVINKNSIEVRTWERGAGYTLACGTGTCASVVACALLGKTNNRVEAVLAGGRLLIEYNEGSVYMTGPAELICEGEIKIV